MELMEQGTLHLLLCERKRLPETTAQLYAAEIVLAVSFLHEIGVAHR
jgi:serine/threonine protein kinase